MQVVALNRSGVFGSSAAWQSFRSVFPERSSAALANCDRDVASNTTRDIRSFEFKAHLRASAVGTHPLYQQDRYRGAQETGGGPGPLPAAE